MFFSSRMSLSHLRQCFCPYLSHAVVLHCYFPEEEVNIIAVVHCLDKVWFWKKEKTSYLCTVHGIQHANTLWVQRKAKFLCTKHQQLHAHVRQARSVARSGSGTTTEEPLLETRSTAGGQPGESPCKTERC